MTPEQIAASAASVGLGGVGSIEPLTHNHLNPVTGGIWRVEVGGAPAVLKWTRLGDQHAANWPAGAGVDHWNYWRREVRAYESDLLGACSELGVRMPRVLGIDDRADGTVALWLEHVDGTDATAWSADRLGRFAAGWGRAQHALANRHDDWLARRWIERYLAHRSDDPALFDDDRAWAAPEVSAVFGSAERNAFRRLWSDQELFLEILDSLPQVLTHHDMWPLNLRAGSDGSDVIVDWAVVGLGAVGVDISNLILDTFFDLLVDERRLDEIERAVTEGYLAAVPDPESALLGIHAAAVKFCWLPLRMVVPSAGSVYEPADTTRADLFTRRAPVLIRMLEWADDARAKYRSRRSTHPSGA